jgi:hypothetical protein
VNIFDNKETHAGARTTHTAHRIVTSWTKCIFKV